MVDNGTSGTGSTGVTPAIARRLLAAGLLLGFFVSAPALSGEIKTGHLPGSGSHAAASTERGGSREVVMGAEPTDAPPSKPHKFVGTPPCLAWVDPDNEPRAVLLCVHGCGLHNGTYEAFAKLLAPRGIATYAVDVRGFGSWQRSKGHENVDFDGCLDDVLHTLKILHKVHPKLPVYIMGESMGGAIALRAASMYPDQVTGLISSVPAGDRFKQTSTDLRVAMRYIFGANKKFRIGDSIVEQATKKKDLTEAWSGDPLAKLDMSPKELLQFQQFCNGNKKAARAISGMPVLFVQGKGDKLIVPLSTYEIFDSLNTNDKKIIAINKAEHLIFEEAQFNQPFLNDVMADMVTEWIVKPLPKEHWDTNAKAADELGHPDASAAEADPGPDNTVAPSKGHHGH